MTDSNSTPPPAGWYPDPAGSPRTRWWNGFGWSDTYGAPVPSTTPTATASANTPAYSNAQPYATTQAYATTQNLTAPEGTSPYTPAIWALAVLPVISLVVTFATGFDADQLVAEALDPTAPPFTASDLITGAIGWLVILLSILFGVLDWRALNRAGVPRPFHWAWIFFAVIGAPVYMVGRSIVVRKRVGSGLAPMVINLLLVVANFVAGIVISVLLIGEIMPVITEL